MRQNLLAGSRLKATSIRTVYTVRTIAEILLTNNQNKEHNITTYSFNIIVDRTQLLQNM